MGVPHSRARRTTAAGSTNVGRRRPRVAKRTAVGDGESPSSGQRSSQALAVRVSESPSRERIVDAEFIDVDVEDVAPPARSVLTSVDQAKVVDVVPIGFWDDVVTICTTAAVRAAEKKLREVFR